MLDVGALKLLILSSVILAVSISSELRSSSNDMEFEMNAGPARLSSTAKKRGTQEVLGVGDPSKKAMSDGAFRNRLLEQTLHDECDRRAAEQSEKMRQDIAYACLNWD